MAKTIQEMKETASRTEVFVAWFLWRCGRGEIRSSKTRATAMNLYEEYFKGPFRMLDWTREDFMDALGV